MAQLIANRPILGTTSALAEVMARARSLEQGGRKIFHMERGEPNFDTPPHIVEALARAARDGETHYPDARGTIQLREALAAKLERDNAIRCHVDDLVVAVGGTHSLFLAIQAMLGPGDELLVLSPHWMAIPKIIAFTPGSTYRTVEAYLELQDGSLSPAAFADRLRASIGPTTRGIYLNTPNNPTGAVLTGEQLQALADVAIERDLWVISDEAYEHILFDGARHVSLASLPGMAERTVSVYTFSKSYAMTGWRIGYSVAPPALRAELGPLLCFYSTHGVFPAVQTAATAALTGPQDAVEEMRAAYERRRNLLLEGLAGQSAIHAPTPAGAFYVFANVEAARGDRKLWDLVLEWVDLGVAVLPGTAFGPEYEGWVRMSLAARDEDVAGAAELLRGHYVGAGAAE